MKRQNFPGKFPGRVTNRNDPAAAGRVEVTVPAVLGDLAVWALPCVPYAGLSAESASIPQEGTNVWVEFQRGDPDRPIWVGCFWPDGDGPVIP